MTEMTWPQFKHAHSGMENEEISNLWKRFKEGKYQFKGEVGPATEEAPREESEVDELAQIQPVTELESEQSDDEAEEEPIEPAQGEESPPESVEEPEPTPEPVGEPTASRDFKSHDRLRDFVIFGI